MTMRTRRQFDPRSEEFLDNMQARATRYARVFMSPRQASWLQDLARQAGLT